MLAMGRQHPINRRLRQSNYPTDPGNGLPCRTHLLDRRKLVVGDFPAPTFLRAAPPLSISACDGLASSNTLRPDLRFVFGDRSRSARRSHRCHIGQCTQRLGDLVPILLSISSSSQELVRTALIPENPIKRPIDDARCLRQKVMPLTGQCERPGNSHVSSD
jgi:hypothetical protein